MGLEHTFAVCSAVTLGAPPSQTNSGRQTRPPSEAMCTAPAWRYTDTKPPMPPARRAARMPRTSFSGARCTPRMLPLRDTMATDLHGEGGAPSHDVNMWHLTAFQTESERTVF